MSKKIAYVTGGMGGIGTTMCQRLHRDGFTVIAGCGPSRDFKKWLDEQSALGYTFHASVGNVGDWNSTVAAFQQVKAEHGPIDVLVNNAGITRDGMFRKMSRADWDAVIETNLTSLFNVTKQVIEDMLDKGWGRIINISSVNGEKGQFGQTNYSAAKAATPEAAAALAAEIIEHCKQHLARFKCPKEVRFAVVPKTSTGKIQKHVLRGQVGSAGAIG